MSGEIPLYIDIMKRHPPLSREMEVEIATKARAGSPRHRSLMVNHNIGLVLRVVNKYKRANSFQDLVQEGMTGLTKAIDKFEPGKGFRFSTYASWWIEAYVGKYARESSAVKPSLNKETGQWHYAGMVSLNAPAYGGEDTTYLDLLEDSAPLLEEQAERASESSRVRNILKKVKISPLGRDIIKMRLATDDPATLAEIGKRRGLSRERVRQVEKEVKQRLERVLAA